MKYAPARRPWAHQRRADRFMDGVGPVAALRMAMRTGKSKVLLDRFGRLELAGAVHDLGMIAPAGVYRTWVQQVQDHCSDDLRRRLMIHVWESGAGVVHRRMLDAFMRERGRPRLLLMNVEATSTVKAARDVMDEFLEQRISMGTYDESTTIKGHDSERALYAVQHVRPRTNYRYILTGLLTPHNPLDAYMQFNFLDPAILGFPSFLAYKTRHSVLRNVPVGRQLRDRDGAVIYGPDGKPLRRGHSVTVGFREVSGIRKKIDGRSFQVRLEDCYDMPPKMYSYRDVEWHPEQRRVYDELRQFATVKLASQEFVTVSQVITELLRLQQILCGHVRTEGGELREVPERRTDSLLDMLEEYDGKAVIWCSYDYNVQKIVAAIQRRFAQNGVPAKVARFWGGNRKTREEEDRMFREDPECRWMVATPAAGKFGRYWAVANLAVFFSNSQYYEDRHQGEARVQAYEKTTSVGVVDMRVPGTRDDDIIDCLKRSHDLAQEIDGGEWREWIR